MRAARLELELGSHGAAVEGRLARWRRESVARRLVARDPTLWPSGPASEAEERLGWLDLPHTGEDVLGDWQGFAAAEREAGVRDALVVGMGGSSLAPEVFERTFGGGRAVVRVLDSTHPEAVRRAAERLDPEHSLFVVSSKSGTTVETLSLFRYLWERSAEVADRGRRFVAITDPGSPLQALAARHGFHRVFTAPPDVGGRYSALSPFGLVPAALSGVDIRTLVARAREASRSLETPARAEPLVALGAVLGEFALAGVDKLTFVVSEAIASLPDWIEQLVAESTGKQRRGILPVVGEAAGPPEIYGDDRLFAGLLLDDDRGGPLEARLEALAEAGHPVLVCRLRDRLDVGFEMLRWEIAVALAGVVLEIDPFSQPDVERAKRLARGMMEGDAEVRRAIESIERLPAAQASAEMLGRWLDAAHAGPYLSVCAYLPASAETAAKLSRLQVAMRRRARRVVTVGIGPRFLHSTGQLHKGGPRGACFLQLVAPAERDVPIPGSEATFGELIAAQADGDAAALVERGQVVLRLDLGPGPAVEAELEGLVRRLEELG